MKTISETAQTDGVHPQLVGQWKKEILESAGALFETKRGPIPAEDKSGEERPYGEIGLLKMEVDLLKNRPARFPAPLLNRNSGRVH